MRPWLAIIVSLAAIILIGTISVVAIQVSDTKTETAQYVLTSVLPLLGAWVVTVLAFYFSNDSWRVAAQGVVDLTRSLTPQERLKSIPVQSVMIKVSDIKGRPSVAPKIGDSLDTDAFNISTLLKGLKSANVHRLVVLSDQDRPMYCIHDSWLNDYLNQIHRRYGARQG